MEKFETDYNKFYWSLPQFNPLNLFCDSNNNKPTCDYQRHMLILQWPNSGQKDLNLQDPSNTWSARSSFGTRSLVSILSVWKYESD
jgi:hypothetical protein